MKIYRETASFKLKITKLVTTVFFYMAHTLFQSVKNEGKFPNSFYEVSIPKLDKKIAHKKRKKKKITDQTNMTKNSGSKTLNKI